MVIASFKNKIFKISFDNIYTFDGLTRGASVTTEEQEAASGKPSTLIKGLSLEDLSFNVTLRRSKTIDVRKEIDSWMALLNSKAIDNFILGGKRVGTNKYMLTSATVTDYTIGPGGIILAAKIDLKFKEFARNGVKKDDKPKSSKDDKKKGKRKNKNAKDAKKKGKKSSSSKPNSTSSNSSSSAKVEALEKEIFGE